MSDAVLVTGASGSVGGAVVRALAEAGRPVMALVRDPRAALGLADTGATIVVGDLTDPSGAWVRDAADAAAVVHAGLPRMPAPARGRALGAAARAAEVAARNLRQAVGAHTPVALASGHQVYGDVAGPVTTATPPDPVGFGRVQRAAEDGLGTAGVAVVRLGWVYGAGGFAPGVVSAAVERRLRIVGAGDNPMPLISAGDAAAALLAALDDGEGVYNACEAVPTQRDFVRGVCRAAGVRGPDVLPVRVAGLSLGGGMAQALAARCAVDTTHGAPAGWSPRDAWAEDLVRRAGVPLPPPAGR